MDSTRAITLGCCCLIFAACSSATKHASSSSAHTIGTTSAATETPTDTGKADYVSKVNALCDALLPKVLDALHGGHDGTYPVAVYRSEVTVTDKLEAGFDQQFAAIPVPPTAAEAHAAMVAYISFANKLNAARAVAAAKGQAAFDQETRAEAATARSDPSITNRDAQGFNESCSAR